MNEQIDLFGNLIKNFPKSNKTDKQKRNWENAFQRWSDKEALESTDIYGKCGCGIICDYCNDNSYGRPCIRALNKMCREKRIKIDYSKREFEDIWNGIFVNESGK
jgi:hypothetical protein